MTNNVITTRDGLSIEQPVLKRDDPRIITRVRAVALLLHEGAVLVEHYRQENFITLLGGGLEPGENIRSAVVREVREEIGLAVTIGAPAMTYENLFFHDPRIYREYGFVFRVEPVVPFTAPRPTFTSGEDNLNLGYEWVTLDQLEARNMQPPFITDWLLALRDDSPVEFFENHEYTFED
jgi:8-oxo-dGTP pyrophosphatase MutT (NUDIX family)